MGVVSGARFRWLVDGDMNVEVGCGGRNPFQG